MTDLATYPTDQAICRLLAGEALPTAAIADRLAMPERTARHRLAQLRRAGVVVTGPDGLHRLAAGPLPALADPAAALADPAPAHAEATDSDGPSSNDGGHWGSGAVLAGAAFGLALAGCLAVALLVRRMSPPPTPPPAPPPATWLGNGAGLPGGVGWSPW
jgi:hypothetical protein